MCLPTQQGGEVDDVQHGHGGGNGPGSAEVREPGRAWQRAASHCVGNFRMHFNVNFHPIIIMDKI